MKGVDDNGQKLSLVSYTLATMAGICFVGGIVILSN